MNQGGGSLKRAFLFGFLVWLVPFVISILIFPLKSNLPQLFESIMPVVLTLSLVFFLILYFKTVKGRYLKEGIVLGILWFVIAILLDLFMFMWGPMKMTFVDYMKDIGLTYLIIPTVAIGYGFLNERRLDT